ncbi:hypothetical protein [Nocardioides sp. URHA0032]|jgi:hypothetical protein|uniref:hypothetical protein n=1 Tax=Nocardioides sp. URHA0032 TaxID=1380388 RepID=UPI0012DCA309|nr:hypothetical protein [Nocardioides sp. URHA0032]
MNRRRWWRRAAAGVVVFAVLEVVLELAHAGPDAVRLALLVATCVGVLGLVLDTLSDASPTWTVEVERPSVREGGDPRLSRYVNLIEAHLTARSDDAALRDRLATLTDQVLRQRYAVGRGDPRAEALIGPELAAVISGPVRRLSPADIDRCLTRIEEL